MNAVIIRYFLISLLIFLIGQTGLFKGPRNVLSSTIVPVQYGLTVLGGRLKETVTVTTHILSLTDDNRRLREELENLRGQLVDFKETAAENSQLREQLRSAGELNLAATSLLSADIIGRPEVEGSFLLISRGQVDGVTVGSFVIYKKFLVGTVSETEDHRARVRTIFDPQFRVSAFSLDSPTQARGLVRGEFATSLLMEKILPTEDVTPGETVVTSGDNGVIRGLLLGRVAEVSQGQAQVLKWARLTPFLDLNSLEKVFVVIQ